MTLFGGFVVTRLIENTVAGFGNDPSFLDRLFFAARACVYPETLYITFPDHGDLCRKANN